MIDALINHMVAIVHQHQFTLLDRYPRDLLVHDRAVLERIAVPGASVAWVVGHCHTHITQIGVHREANAHVGYYLNAASSDDRFYRIDFGTGAQGFKFTELDRVGFMALKNSAVAYEQSEYGPRFDLIKNGRKVGHCHYKCLDPITHQYEAHMSPASGATKLDRTALYEWVVQAIYSHGTLFANWTAHWHEATQIAELEAA